MDIIKRLQLNINPKDIKSGSIVGAKNIMLDRVNSSITNEYGFAQAYEAPTGYSIVGAIPCNEEIVIFLYNGSDSKIQRLKDGEAIGVDVTCNWKYENGVIEGTFAYNYKKQLIIAVSEHDSDHDVPLKIINLDDNNTKLTNNLEESIPKIYPFYKISNTGSLVCGTYTFFIRYKISEDTYTKWFQISDDIIITNFISKEAPVHSYEDGTVANQIDHSSSPQFSNFYINENLISSHSIDFEISFSDNNFDKYQLGYIIKRNNEVLGRLFKELSTDELNVSIFDNTFIEEVNVNDFLEIPLQFYNCKNLINYNNRLYLSNYSNYKKLNEDEINELIYDGNNISVGINLLKVQEDIHINKTKLVLKRGGLYYDEGRGSRYDKEYDNIELKEYTYNDSLNFINNYIVPFIDERHHKREKKAIYFITPTDSKKWICLYSDFSDVKVYNNFYIKFQDEKLHIIVDGENYSINGCDCLAVLLYQDYYYNGYHWSNPSNELINRYPKTPTYLGYFNSSYSSIGSIISNTDITKNNNRTLIPGQIYNLFIHFVRKDGSCTDGYKLSAQQFQEDQQLVELGILQDDTYYIEDLDKLLRYKFINENDYFKCPRFKVKNNVNSEFVIVPTIYIYNENKIPDEYVGYFISYEKVEITSLPVVSLDTTTPSTPSYKYTNSDTQYNNNSIKGQILSAGFSNVADADKDKSLENNITNINIYSQSYKEKHFIIDTDDEFISEDFSNPNNSIYHTIIKIKRNALYNAKYKTLFRLTRNIYKKDSYKPDNSQYNTNYFYDVDKHYMYLPGFYNREKAIYYDKQLMFNALSTYVYDPEHNTMLSGTYQINAITKRNYSHICLNALSIKKDYEQGAVVINNKTYLNKVLSPSNASDFLELKQCYKSDPVISYTNYNKNTQDTFDKTIYRSDIISDESLVNGFRHFNLENYKNIIENKGNITNLVGVGLYLLVHTEYSLFIFDRNNQLSDKAQLQIPDTFDIDYKEVIPSGEGFGGLKDKEESILTKHGYIWFDRISKSIFIFDGKSINPLSSDIHNLLKYFFENKKGFYIRFAEDSFSNRLIITIKKENQYITLSYNFDTNCFISSHDYTFDKSYKTYNNTYIYSKDKPNKLFMYKYSSCDYKGLGDNKTSLLETIKTDNKLNSYVDIIFNDLYEVPKVLNSISYIMSKNSDNYDRDVIQTNIIDQYFNLNYKTQQHLNALRLYSGFKLCITTDLTFSNILDIAQDSEINELNSNKPQWNNGIWNFNWFRENLPEDVTKEELDKQNVNKQMQEVYQQHNDLYKSGYEKSDMRSLIVGKYFIFRFIFERNDSDLYLKFETLDVNISKK